MVWSVRYIEPGDVTAVWPVIVPLLAPAVKRSGGRYDMKAVFSDTQSRRVLLWVVSRDKEVHGAMITRTAMYPRAQFLSVDFLGGEDLVAWVEEADRVLCSFARDSGLDGLEMIGRRGWERVLKPFGWAQNAVMLEKRTAGKDMTDG